MNLCACIVISEGSIARANTRVCVCMYVCMYGWVGGCVDMSVRMRMPVTVPPFHTCGIVYL